MSEKISVISETSVNNIIYRANELKPDIIIIDSIQTMFCDELTGAPGSVGQVRETTHTLMRYAKETNTSILIVGHVTKDGNIAGPRVLEHMVDCVLYFEGERHQSYRILRTVKNRFGSTNEIGVFEMKDKGLIEVENPSKMLLSGRPENTSGSAVVCTLEGTRPVLAEIQALTSPTGFGNARRMATGLDYNRAVMLVAILEKKLVVAEAKEEFRELREKEGFTITEYLNALRDQANQDADFLAEAHKMSNELYHDQTVSDEDYIKYRNQINEKLRERGLPEIE
jgi:DNA repair protein RadA/Sms